MSGNTRVPMASFGANLRREREMRGIPLEEIAAATKISIRSLQALEAEEFSKLPGGIFTRSFIRSYARYLGLDEETVMAEFQVLAPRIEEADLSKLSPSNANPPRPRSRVPLLGLLLAVALLAGGYTLFRYSRRVRESRAAGVSSSRLSASTPPATVSPPQTTTAPTTTVANPTGPAAGPGSANSNLQDVSKPAQVAEPSTSKGSNSPPANLALTLQVAATEQTWVAVDADGKTALQGVLKPNDIQTFKAKDSFDLRTGNAQGIILTLNGETLKPLGRHGEYKKVHLTQADIKNFNP